jgi:GTPase SAR1 family protein
MTSFTVDVCGSAGCGKSAFLNRHRTGEFSSDLSEAGPVTLTFRTTEGEFTVECTEGVTDTADARIVMFDLSKPYEEEKLAIAPLLKTDKPKVLFGNKIDVVDVGEIITFREIADLMEEYDVEYLSTSWKSNLNFERSFIGLLRTLTGKSKLDFAV